MNTLKHLPAREWPEVDTLSFANAYAPGDIFEDTCGPGSHLSQGTRYLIETAYGRWLGFLTRQDPSPLLMPPANRITPQRVRAFIDRLTEEVSSMSVLIYVDGL